MSLADAICTAVRIAKQNLGDLIVLSTLKVKGDKTYDVGIGQYTYTETLRDVEVAPEKFTYEELGMVDYDQSDVKLVVFNQTNDIEITTSDQMEYPKGSGTWYEVKKVVPNYVGGYKPVLNVVLRK
jgi:hypothetical protein